MTTLVSLGGQAPDTRPQPAPVSVFTVSIQMCHWCPQPWLPILLFTHLLCFYLLGRVTLRTGKKPNPPKCAEFTCLESLLCSHTRPLWAKAVSMVQLWPCRRLSHPHYLLMLCSCPDTIPGTQRGLPVIILWKQYHPASPGSRWPACP